MRTMGIMTSSYPRMDQFLSEKVGYPWQEPLKKLAQEVIEKESDALFGPLSEARYYEFMRAGPCKESFMSLRVCSEEAGIASDKCKEPMMMLLECMDSHPNYHEPILGMGKTILDHLVNELRGLDAMKQALKVEALAARNQAFRDKNIRIFR